MNFEFIDHLDVAVQVSNIDGEIVYLNKSAKQRLGISTSSEKALYVHDFEPIFKSKVNWYEHVDELRENGSITIRSINNIIGKSEVSFPVEVRVKLIEIKGEEFIVALSENISDRIQVERQLARKQKLLEVISRTTIEMLDSTDILFDIGQALPIIGEAVSVDRTYLFTNTLNKDGQLLTSQRLEWNSGVKDPQIDNPELQNFPISEFDLFLNDLENDKPFEAVVSNMKDGELKRILQSQDIISILIIPIHVNQEFWGFIGYDDCKTERSWGVDELTMLKTFASVISKGLERSSHLKTIESYAQFPLENPQPVFKISALGEVLLANPSSTKLERIVLVNNKEVFMSLEEYAKFIAKELRLLKLPFQQTIQSQKGDIYTVSVKQVKDKKSINVYLANITNLVHTQNELKKAKNDAEYALRVREGFLANMSHEIRTPLNGIYGLISQLGSIVESSEGKEILNEIKVSSKYLLSIVDQILELSKITSDGNILKLSPFLWSDLFEDLSSITSPLIKSKRLKLSFEIAPNIKDLFIGDPVRIKQILLNLISNSIKYTSEGLIHVSVKAIIRGQHSCTFLLRVLDTGIGMSKDFQSKIFDKFSREDYSENRINEGIGLGMSICNELVQRMNGTINVSSEQNKGTTVDIRLALPYRFDDSNKVSQKESVTCVKQMKPVERALVVEDNHINRKVLSLLLTRHNVKYEEAINGKEAILKAREFIPDVVFMDIHMPETDGITATKLLKRNEGFKGRVYALTADVTTYSAEEYQYLGFDGLITKPYEENQILEVLSLNKADERLD